MVGGDSISFDVNPLAPAIRVDRPDLVRRFSNSRLVSIRLELSTFVPSKLQEQVQECLYRIEGRRQDLQVADYFPKTEMTSSVAGNVQVFQTINQHQDANIRGLAGYPGVGWIEGNAAQYKHTERQEVSSEKPAMQVLVASGTLGRRTGTFYRFKRSSQTSLEGEHAVELTLEVPMHWRGDLLDVTMEAFGQRLTHDRQPKSLAQSRFLVAVYLEGDEVAANVAKGHAIVEQRLRYAATIYADEIRKRSEPTPLHKLGVALDVLEPRIRSEWLGDVLFGEVPPYPTGNAAKLPVDVRVAILDYLDQRHAMETLATAGRHQR